MKEMKITGSSGDEHVPNMRGFYPETWKFSQNPCFGSLECQLGCSYFENKYIGSTV